jgi:predicted nucleic-acid-binding protein
MVADRLKEFIQFQDDFVPDRNVVVYGLNLFAASQFDFVDCLIDGYAKVNGNQAFTFDGDLRKRLGEKLYSNA